MPYQWDSIPSYRLQYAVVNQFLMELFGNYDFYTQVNSTPGLLGLNMLYATQVQRYVDADGQWNNTSISTTTFNSGSPEL